MPDTKVYFRGRKAMPAWMRAHYHAQAFKRHGNRVMALPPATDPAYDSSQDQKWYFLPVDDQGQCGDCFGVSSFDVASMALIAAGVLPRSPDSRLSSQFGLDCNAFQGGCNGGDEAQVFDYLKTNGAPLTKDYGPYTANPGRCHDTGLTKYKLPDWGYCTPSQQSGVASTQDMKNCIKAYGPISIAIDAGEFNNYSGGTITGGGSNVDHAIACDGWDDNHDNGDGSKGAWVVRNQWGIWGIIINGIQGRAWVKYGADSCGTESIFAVGGTLPPPPPPPPAFVPPFFLFEGSVPHITPVGDPAGYPDSTTAHNAAQTIANKDSKGVLIYDKADALVDIVAPLPPPPPPAPATFTIPDGGLSFSILGFKIGHISGGTFPLSTSVGLDVGALPPWVLEMILADLRILCTQAVNLPSPWNTWAGIACGLIPPADHHRMAFANLTVESVPSWLLPLLRILCTFASLIPPPIGTAIAFACSLLPASISGTSPCGGCK